MSLLAGADGKPRHDFRGKLSFSWPKRIDQTPLNKGDAGYDPLFAFGYGLTYKDQGDLPTLSEDRPAAATRPDGTVFARGTLPPGWRFDLAEPGGVAEPVTGNAGATGAGARPPVERRPACAGGCPQDRVGRRRRHGADRRRQADRHRPGEQRAI